MEQKISETLMTKSKVSQSTHKSLKKGEERNLAEVSENENSLTTNLKKRSQVLVHKQKRKRISTEQIKP